MTAPLYQENLISIPPAISEVLEHYSNIPVSEQVDHVLTLRDRAYKSHPYPCLGRFRFLELDLASHPLYHSYILPFLRGTLQGSLPDPTFLDLGTCLGQDIRKLIYDGVPVSSVYGADIVQDFIDTGYELFRDKDRLPRTRFICPADIFDTSASSNLSILDNRVDILQATAVFHLFDYEKQVATARRCLSLLRKNAGRKSLIVGGQAGNVEGKGFERNDGVMRFRHNPDTWRKMWSDVCAEPEWKAVVKHLTVEADLEERSNLLDSTSTANAQKQIGDAEKGFRWMTFSVWFEF